MKSLFSISKKLNTTKKEVGYIKIYDQYLKRFKAMFKAMLKIRLGLFQPMAKASERLRRRLV